VGGVEQHVDRVQGKKPGLLEQLRVSIVPVAFIGVGVGLLVNKRSAERREEEIRTTVRRPQGGNTGPAAPYGGQQASTTPRNDAPPRRGNS
jgi:hypothetical protein